MTHICENRDVACVEVHDKCPDCPERRDTPTNALGQPSPNRTDFTKWQRENLERFAREVADENLVERKRIAGGLYEYRLVVNNWSDLI